MPATRFTSRIDRVAQELQDLGLDAMLASTPVSMGYLHGLFEGSHERFMVLAINAEGKVRLICPALTETQARRADIEDVQPWRDGEEPMDAFRQLAEEWNLRTGVIAVDEFMPARFLLELQDVLPAALYRPGGELMARLMRVKEPVEVEKLRAAGAVVDEVYEATYPFIHAGMSEMEVQTILEDGVRARGAKTTFCIVGAGPGSGEPHHLNDDRRIQSGDVVLLDFGCELDHYQADITRCIVVGKASDEVKKVYKTVYDSHMAGRRAVKPGVACEQVDAAARKVIQEAGYGPQFMHRLGHGIGMNGHEQPNIVEGNKLPLEPGHCFSIEPGIYLEGKFGIRIENIVAVTNDGHDSLNAEPPAEIPEV